MSQEKDIGSEIIDAMEGFLDKLKSGEPIEATRLERVETPDGPMHIRSKVTLLGKEESE